MSIKRLTVSALTGVGALVISAQGTAQNASTSGTADEATLSEVVVTGSRVIANGNNSPTPVTIVSTDELLQNQPQTIAQALQSLPVFVGSLGQNTNPGGASTNNAANVVNLRNIGLTRTLVLYDGHRVPSTSPTGLVDVDMIPQMLLQRVDVVTGGASAVYGSDAISGVVNFITNPKFNGLKAYIQTGKSEYDDDKTADVGLAAGTGFMGDRAHVEFSYQYRESPGVYTRLTRPRGQEVWTAQGAGTAANPYRPVQNSRLSTLSFGGLINSGPLNGQQFGQNGVLSPFVHGTATGASGVESGGDGTYFYPASLKSGFRSHQAFARTDFDFNESVHAYVALSATWNWNQNIWGYNSLTNVPISNSNAFLTAAQQAAAGAATGSFNFSKAFLQWDPVSPTTREKHHYILANLAGKFADGYRWEVSATHSEARQNTAQLNNLQRERLYAALDAVVNPATGQIVCQVSTTANAALYPGCVPLNVFGPTSESQAAIDYVSATTQYWGLTRMEDLAANLTGAPLSSWAGPINMALSAEWRRLRFEDTSTGLPLATMNCTGLRFCQVGTAASNLWQSGSYGEWQGSQTVSELAYEVNVPVLAGKRFAENVGINAAARYADYDTNGGVWAWKTGLDWQVGEQLTVRATRSRDIRAPNLNDLFSAPLVARNTFNDTLTGQALPQFATTTTANPDLKPEIADTTTAGFVYRPEWLQGFSLAVDGYETRISDAIVSLSGGTATVQRACTSSGGTSIYCSLVTRPLGYANTTPANNATAAFTKPINVATLRTYGADVEANYATSLRERPASVRLFMTYQPHLTLVTPGIGVVDMGGAAFGPAGFVSMPQVRVTAMLSYSPIENLSVSVLERWRSKLRWNGDRSLVYDGPDIPAVAYTHLNVGYTIKLASAGETQVFFNVQNLFDKAPPLAPPTSTPGQNAANADGDDFIGRYYTLGMRYKF
jgi:iron complex outermembrane receptor protein